VAYDRDAIFTRVGKFVKLHSSVLAYRDTLDGIDDEFQDVFLAYTRDREAVYARVASDLNTFKARMTAMADTVKRRVDTYIRDHLSIRLDTSFTGVDEILARLVVEMNNNGDTVQRNDGHAGTAEVQIRNAYAGTFSAIAATNLARDAWFDVVCVSTGTQGSEKWRVQSSVEIEGSKIASVQAETDEEYTWTAAGITFTISSGSTIVEAGDDVGQCSNWVLTGYSTANTNKGVLYARVLGVVWSPYGQNQILLYKDSDFDAADLVASGTIVGPGEVTLAEANGSGLSGSVDFAPNYGTLDQDITLTVPLFVAGDYFRFRTWSDDDNGLFAKFFREQYDVLLPNAAYYGVTIPDSLAQ